MFLDPSGNGDTAIPRLTPIRYSAVLQSARSSYRRDPGLSLCFAPYSPRFDAIWYSLMAIDTIWPQPSRIHRKNGWFPIFPMLKFPFSIVSLSAHRSRNLSSVLSRGIPVCKFLAASEMYTSITYIHIHYLAPTSTGLALWQRMQKRFHHSRMQLLLGTHCSCMENTSRLLRLLGSLQVGIPPAWQMSAGQKC